MRVMRIVRIAGLLTAGIIAVSSTLIAVPSVAAYPKGVISQSVQNQTTKGILKEANDSAEAVRARSGDMLKYVIEVRNNGSADDTNSEMHAAKLSGTLPSGLELVSDPGKRTISENLGSVQASSKATREYQVKVTSGKEGEVIENKICFTGNSKAKDSPQKGCDVAVVKIDKNRPDSSPLPSTGASGIFAPLVALTAGSVAYIGRLRVLQRRTH